MRRALAAAGLLFLAGCLRFGQPAGPPRGTYPERLTTFARLLRQEDRRFFEPILTGRAASSPDAWIRAKAALSAGRLQDRAAGPHLLVLLRDEEPAVRRAAAFACGISADARMVPHLARSLEDPDEETRARAADALGRLGGADATAALLAALERDGAQRPAAARALFHAPDEGILKKLEPLAASPATPLRRAALYALAQKPLLAALPVLRRALYDPDVRVRALAARAAGILADRDTADALERLALDADPSVATQALAALRALGRKGPVPPGACEAARRRAAEAHPGVATTALGALAGCRDSGSDALLHEAVANGGPRGEEALGALVAHGLTDVAEEAARSASLELRLGAATAIESLPKAVALRVAERLLGDPLPRVRAAAAGALPDDAPRALLEKALGDPDAAVREAALEKAAPRRAEVAAAWDHAYAAAFREENSDFTVGALQAAAALGKEGEALLRAKADHRDAVVRATARRLLVSATHAKPEGFDLVPVATRTTARDYERIARQANEEAFTAEVTTSRGAFTIALDAEEAPLTVETFRELAARRFFDGTVIHRVVPDFVVQAGDPRGDGSGGPGFSIRDERNALPYERGAVGMALSGPDTGGSQWFVTLSPQPHLEATYTVFGKVVSGMEVVDRIEKDDRLLSFRVASARREPPSGILGPR